MTLGSIAPDRLDALRADLLRFARLQLGRDDEAEWRDEERQRDRQGRRCRRLGQHRLCVRRLCLCRLCQFFSCFFQFFLCFFPLFILAQPVNNTANSDPRPCQRSIVLWSYFFVITAAHIFSRFRPAFFTPYHTPAVTT